MSLGLTKPGASVALRHPKTGVLLEPLGFIRGKAVWPALGASSDDPDDPAFMGGAGGSGGSPRHEDDEDDEDDDDSDDDSEDESEDDEEPKKSRKDKEPTRPERQAARYRVKLREEQQKNRELEERIRKIEDADKPTDELMQRDLAETRAKLESLTEVNQIMAAQLAFFKSNTIDWVDSTDAFNLAEKEGLFDDVIDEDGNVDVAELRRGLKDLARRKSHLVKKSTKASGQDDEDDDEPSSRSSASPMNKRRGQPKASTDRAALRKRFPVLGR